MSEARTLYARLRGAMFKWRPFPTKALKAETHEWGEPRKDPFWPDEAKLFYFSFRIGHECWQTRCEWWLTHVNVSAYLKCNAEQSPQWQSARIDFLFAHLGVLDTKFNVLLAINTLLLIAANNLLNFAASANTSHVIGVPLGWSVVLFGIFWIITTITCLVGERRLVWGDLGRIGARRFTWQQLKPVTASSDPNNLIAAVEEHVKTLIVAVAKRTNKFRVAMGLTYINVVFLFATAITALQQVWKPHV
jgi:hypothetical protein